MFFCRIFYILNSTLGELNKTTEAFKVKFNVYTFFTNFITQNKLLLETQVISIH